VNFKVARDRRSTLREPMLKIKRFRFSNRCCLDLFTCVILNCVWKSFLGNSCSLSASRPSAAILAHCLPADRLQQSLLTVCQQTICSNPYSLSASRPTAAVLAHCLPADRLQQSLLTVCQQTVCSNLCSLSASRPSAAILAHCLPAERLQQSLPTVCQQTICSKH
jgi:ornithine carbamoyltransferase